MRVAAVEPPERGTAAQRGQQTNSASEMEGRFGRSPGPVPARLNDRYLMSYWPFNQIDFLGGYVCTWPNLDPSSHHKPEDI